MYKIMTVWDMQEELKKYNCEYHFSDEGLEAIDNYYSGRFPDEKIEIKFNVIDICCKWDEYGNGVVLGFDDFINDFEYLIDDDKLEELDDDEKVDAIYQKLEDKTYCVRLENGNILQMIF